MRRSASERRRVWDMGVAYGKELAEAAAEQRRQRLIDAGFVTKAEQDWALRRLWGMPDATDEKLEAIRRR